MRLKTLLVALGIASIVPLLMFGTRTCAQLDRSQASTSNEPEEAAGREEVPSPTEGGVENVNENLGEMKDQVQERVDERPEGLDERIERSGGRGAEE